MIREFPRTALTLADGSMFDLLNPKPEQIDFSVIAQHLAKANRYCGATPLKVYSVAEHSCRCAYAASIYAEGAPGGDKMQLARYLLCHDMHEAFLGDDTTPKKRALAAIMFSFGALAETIERAFAQLTDRLDAAIHARAGLQWPPPPAMIEHIKYYDRVLLATEWRDLMQCAPPFNFGVAPLEERITPEPNWLAAMLRFEADCVFYLDWTPTSPADLRDVIRPNKFQGW